MRRLALVVVAIGSLALLASTLAQGNAVPNGLAYGSLGCTCPLIEYLELDPLPPGPYFRVVADNIHIFYPAAPARMNPAQLAAWMHEAIPELGIRTVGDMLRFFCGSEGVFH
jgi:hypothetical protein